MAATASGILGRIPSILPWFLLYGRCGLSAPRPMSVRHPRKNPWHPSTMLLLLGTMEREDFFDDPRIISSQIQKKRKTVATVSPTSSEESLASLHDLDFTWNGWKAWSLASFEDHWKSRRCFEKENGGHCESGILWRIPGILTRSTFPYGRIAMDRDSLPAVILENLVRAAKTKRSGPCILWRIPGILVWWKRILLGGGESNSKWPQRPPKWGLILEVLVFWEGQQTAKRTKKKEPETE